MFLFIFCLFFFFTDTATSEIYTLSLHDALPISGPHPRGRHRRPVDTRGRLRRLRGVLRSEEHTSELQSRFDLVCRLLLEKKKNSNYENEMTHQTPLHSFYSCSSSPRLTRIICSK